MKRNLKTAGASLGAVAAILFLSLVAGGFSWDSFLAFLKLLGGMACFGAFSACVVYIAELWGW